MGRRAVIVGNGASVDRLPPAAWGQFGADCNCLLVGTNRALAFEALQGVSLDAVVLRDRCRNLWHGQEWGVRYEQELWNPASARRVGRDRTVCCDEYVRFAPGWQHDPVPDESGAVAVMLQNSVVLMAANWAWLQGARELLLVGVDYGGPYARMIRPWCDAPLSWQGQYEKPVPGYVEREFATAVGSVESLGGRLLNLSEGSRLRSVPAATWQDVWESWPHRDSGGTAAGGTDSRTSTWQGA